MVKIRLEIKNELVLNEKCEQFRTELLDQLASDGVLVMEAVTPKKSSRGANSYRVINNGENSREIRNDTFYLPYVNDGTGIYGPRHTKITPKIAKFLHFNWKGKEWFLKSVRGQPPKKFVEKGVNDIVESVDKVAAIASRRVFG